MSGEYRGGSTGRPARMRTTKRYSMRRRVQPCRSHSPSRRTPIRGCVSPSGHRRKRQEWVEVLNIAKVMEDDPTPLRLNALETLDRVAERIDRAATDE